MSKAVLVMDMPKSCDMCDFTKMVNGKMYCGVPEYGELVEDYISCRPDRCPMRLMPEKKDIVWASNMTELGWIDGWNACIDMIGG